jgi:hypothetical protein
MTWDLRFLPRVTALEQLMHLHELLVFLHIKVKKIRIILAWLGLNMENLQQMQKIGLMRVHILGERQKLQTIHFYIGVIFRSLQQFAAVFTRFGGDTYFWGSVGLCYAIGNVHAKSFHLKQCGYN